MILLLACYQEVTQSCERAIEPIDDDSETSEGLSPAHLINDAPGPQDVEAIDLYGQPLTLTVDLARAEGQAYIEQAELVNTRVSGSGGETYIVGYANDRCLDDLFVPATLTVDAADGTVAITAAGTLSLAPDQAYDTALFEGQDDAAVLPEGRHGPTRLAQAWVSWSGHVIFGLELHALAEDGTDELVVATTPL